MRHFSIWITVLLTAVLVACTSVRHEEVVWHCDPLKIVGTFSDLRYDEREAKIVGVEIRIVPANRSRYQASVQFGEGEGLESSPSELLVVDVVFDFEQHAVGEAYKLPSAMDEAAEGFSFTIPTGTGYSGEFSGNVYRDRIEGLFRFADGRTNRVVVPRVPDGTCQ